MPDEPLVVDLSLKLPHQGDDVRQAKRGLDLRKWPDRMPRSSKPTT